MECDKGPFNMIMGLSYENRGPQNVNRGPCNVISGPWNVDRGPWNVIGAV